MAFQLTDNIRLSLKKISADASYRFEMNPNTNSYDKITYSVQLKGLDEQMLALNASGIKEYTGLKEGNYTFLICAYNHHTHQTGRRNSSQILPPGIRSIYAYIMYVLLLVVLGYGIYKLLNQRFNKQHQKTSG